MNRCTAVFDADLGDSQTSFQCEQTESHNGDCRITLRNGSHLLWSGKKDTGSVTVRAASPAEQEKA